MSWLDETHDDYERLQRRAEFARLYRTGEVQQRAENQARHITRQATGISFKGQTEGLSKWAQHTSDLHLMQRSQGERVEAYIERVMVSRYPRHFARIVTSFIGSILQVESEKSTQWGP
ncbi:MAG: hypothetical protein GVY12_04005, partial [Bacteroidetes bacterium]|nr:hypothetical protein [Bacteroidota bacterium]